MREAWAWSKFVHSRESFFPRFSFTVSYKVLVRKIPLKLIVASTCLKKKEKRAKALYLISIQRVEQPSTSAHTTIRSCRVSLKLWFDNVNWNSCKYLYITLMIYLGKVCPALTSRNLHQRECAFIVYLHQSEHNSFQSLFQKHVRYYKVYFSDVVHIIKKKKAESYNDV